MTSSGVVIIARLGRFYTQSSMLILALILFCYGMSVITMAFMLTPFFDKAKKAGALGTLATVSKKW